MSRPFSIKPGLGFKFTRWYYCFLSLVFMVVSGSNLIALEADNTVTPVGQAVFAENQQLWTQMDALNKELSSYTSYVQADHLERLFKETAQLAGDEDLADEFQKLREEAFETNDFMRIDSYAARCKPGINVEIMGESNNIGVNIEYFLGKSQPGSSDFRFFQLARHGFYLKANSHVIGIAEFPIWIERTESSFQGKTLHDVAKDSIIKWQAIRSQLKGIYRCIADDTIDSLKSFLPE